MLECTIQRYGTPLCTRHRSRTNKDKYNTKIFKDEQYGPN